MNILDYQPIVKLTAVYPDTVSGFGLNYTYLGILDEYEEYTTERIKLEFHEEKPSIELRSDYVKECGDLIWYITALCDILKLNTSDILMNKEAIYNNDRNRIYVIGDLAGNIKKHYRDNKPINKELFTNVLKTLCAEIHTDIEYINSTDIDKITLEEILDVNYKKLINRKENNKIHGDGSNR